MACAIHILGHIDKFIFCIKTLPMLWRLDGDWLYFQLPGTWIISWSWHAWYIPGTYRHIYIMYQNPVCNGTWMDTDYISMSVGHELVPVHDMRDLSLGHIDTFTFCIKTPLCHGALMETHYIFLSPGHELVLIHGMRDMFLRKIDKFTFCIKCYVMAPGWRLIIIPCPRDMN